MLVHCPVPRVLLHKFRCGRTTSCVYVGFGTVKPKLGRRGPNLVELECHTQLDFYCQVTASRRARGLGGGYGGWVWGVSVGVGGCCVVRLCIMKIQQPSSRTVVTVTPLSSCLLHGFGYIINLDLTLFGEHLL